MRAHREYARPPPVGTSGLGAVARFPAATFDVPLLGRDVRFFAHVGPADRHTDAPDALSHAELCAEMSCRAAPPAAVLRLSNGVRDVEEPPRDAPPVHTVITLSQRFSRADADPVPPPPADPLCFAAFASEVRRVVLRAPKGAVVPLAVHCHHGCNRTGQLLVWLSMRAANVHMPEQLSAALARFGRARAAAGARSAMGVYDEDVLWALHLFFFACPPVRRLNERRDAPPWRQPRAPSAAPSEWAESTEFSAVPRPGRVFGTMGGRARDVARDNPLEAIGSRTEWAEEMVMNASVRSDLTRAAGRGFVGAMPHELLDASVLRAGYMVSVKADGTRAQLAYDHWGAALVLRNNQVVPVNVMRPEGASLASLDGELMWPARYGDPVMFLAFDIIRLVADDGRDTRIGHMPFHARAEKLAHIAENLNNRVGAMAGRGAGHWSRVTPPAAAAQTVRIEHKKFFCLCYAPALADDAAAVAAMPETCVLCGCAPPTTAAVAAYAPSFADGLVFYRATAADLRDARANAVLKVKRSDAQTVDFLVAAAAGGGGITLALAGSKGACVNVTAFARVSGEDHFAHMPAVGHYVVMEFALRDVVDEHTLGADAVVAATKVFFAAAPGEAVALPVTLWKFVRVRKDKASANSCEARTAPRAPLAAAGAVRASRRARRRPGVHQHGPSVPRARVGKDADDARARAVPRRAAARRVPSSAAGDGRLLVGVLASGGRLGGGGGCRRLRSPPRPARRAARRAERTRVQVGTRLRGRQQASAAVRRNDSSGLFHSPRRCETAAP